MAKVESMTDDETDQAALFGEDGLLYAPRFQDHYFSRHDGRAETEHVFLAGNGLPARFGDGETFTVGELGFGTGLNFLVTWAAWRALGPATCQLHFVSVEGFPLDVDQAEQALSVWPELADLVSQMTDNWPFSQTECRVTRHWEKDRVTLTVFKAQADKSVPHFPMIDAWYLDGFAPARNESMWEADLLAQVYQKTNPGGTFASYTAAGQVRRDLAAAGFVVERREGFGHKRHMIAGHRPLPSPVDRPVETAP